LYLGPCNLSFATVLSRAKKTYLASERENPRDIARTMPATMLSPAPTLLLIFIDSAAARVVCRIVATQLALGGDTLHLRAFVDGRIDSDGGDMFHDFRDLLYRCDIRSRSRHRKGEAGLQYGLEGIRMGNAPHCPVRPTPSETRYVRES